jgi:hypothetical protein
MKVIASSSKQMPIKEVFKNKKTLFNYSFTELLMLGFAKKYLMKEKADLIIPLPSANLKAEIRIASRA